MGLGDSSGRKKPTMNNTDYERGTLSATEKQASDSKEKKLSFLDEMRIIKMGWGILAMFGYIIASLLFFKFLDFLGGLLK